VQTHRPLLALGLIALLAGCGGRVRASPPALQIPAAPRKPAPAQFLHVSASRHAVALDLIAGKTGSNRGFNFDGYGRGELLVTVPRGWRVTVHCQNRASLRNSCAVISGPDTATPAFAGAATPNPVIGIGTGESATFSFTASRIGVYRLASLVPGHEQARMYDVLQVTRGGRPSISARPGP
jgi:Sulfocyanin (SoxE) domain